MLNAGGFKREFFGRILVVIVGTKKGNGEVNYIGDYS